MILIILIYDSNIYMKTVIQHQTKKEKKYLDILSLKIN